MRRRWLDVYGFWLGYFALVLLAVGVWLFFSRLVDQRPQKDLITGVIGGIIGSIITLILAHVAYRQLYSLSSTASGDFILKMKRDFFQEKTRRLMQFVTEDWIVFVDTEASEHFRVKEEEVKKSALHEQIVNWLLEVKAYSAFDVDDLLLGHFEDLATLWDNGLLEIDMIYEFFSWYIDTSWRNCEIQRYVKNQRTKESPNVYEGFERLYDECRKIEKVGGKPVRERKRVNRTA